MTLSNSIGPHLPLLRRYARALTGRQDAGDAYVAAVLEVLIENPKALARQPDPKVALFRTFSAVFNSIDVNLYPRGSCDTGTSADERLEAMAPRPRQAFLLRAMDGFTLAETAAILAVNEREVERLLAQAGAEISEQVAARALIIEDEPLISLDLENILRELGHYVVATARTRDEAIAAARRETPELVLADIQLADGSSGLDAVNKMLESFSVPIIFITGHPERLLTGERPDPAFLIVKPYQSDTVKAIVSQALFFDQRAKPRAKALSA
jgi:DNA-directed RNA polymerase specialized sigma24 family protein